MTDRRNSLARATTYAEALRDATAMLRDADGAEAPTLDAQVLLSHVTGVSRAALVAFGERPLTPEQAQRYAELVARRVAREPVAYLVGEREFMGLAFQTDERALIPRPETELLVEAALADVRERLARAPASPPLVADIGTGTGAIALALAVLEPRLARLYATDLSADALALAAENARRLGVASRVTLLEGDLLSPLPERVDLLVANLPYVAPRDAPTLPSDVSQYEPALALYGADDGLGHLRRFFAGASQYLLPAASIYLEFGYDQRAAIEELTRGAFPDASWRVGADYAGWDRFIVIHLREDVGASSPQA